MSKWAREAEICLKKNPKSYRDAAYIHELINELLTRLRSGCRRRSARNIRTKLRLFREKLCSEWRFPKVK